MTSAKSIFNDRKNEINAYFNYLKQYQPQKADDSVYKILKSNLILMLYNLIESSISNAIGAIHNNIHSQSVSFNDLKTELKYLIINHIKNINPKEFVTNIDDIAIDISKHSFTKTTKRKLFSGNIDRDTLKELSENYCFNINNTDYQQTGHGKSLVTIKNKRNDLAHGVFSFTEVGKEYTIEDLEKMKTETINYIEAILANIELYLLDRKYLK